MEDEKKDSKKNDITPDPVRENAVQAVRRPFPFRIRKAQDDPVEDILNKPIPVDRLSSLVFAWKNAVLFGNTKQKILFLTGKKIQIVRLLKILVSCIIRIQLEFRTDKIDGRFDL